MKHTPPAARPSRADRVQQQLEVFHVGGDALLLKEVVSALTGLSSRSIDRAVQRGDFAKVKVGPRQVRFTAGSLRQFLVCGDAR
ncbi:hypothetical protein [Comamonas sp.]|uniref:helix-turn-helix transcriptional regulator n=1 Tax=Comamonas sp. TaxID=34028 RepID=UPI0028A27B2F|nr:hypothetical protein [Comamonas sp.]